MNALCIIATAFITVAMWPVRLLGQSSVAGRLDTDPPTNSVTVAALPGGGGIQLLPNGDLYIDPFSLAGYPNAVSISGNSGISSATLQNGARNVVQLQLWKASNYPQPFVSLPNSRWPYTESESNPKLITLPEAWLPGHIVTGKDFQGPQGDKDAPKATETDNPDPEKVKTNAGLLAELDLLYDHNAEWIREYLADEKSNHLTIDQQIAQRAKDIKLIKRARAQKQSTAQTQK